MFPIITKFDDYIPAKVARNQMIFLFGPVVCSVVFISLHTAVKLKLILLRKIYDC